MTNRRREQLMRLNVHTPGQRRHSQAHRCVSFGLGRVVISPGASAALAAVGEAHGRYLRQHATGDWSQTHLDEREENLLAIKHGRGIFSTYRLRDGAPLWIATTDDRSRTVIFVPSEV
jgi:hypothetical protein